MVKNCSNKYPDENEIIYGSYFEKYPFPLSSFQKHSIEAIVEGQHILVTAHTGSGKTLPAEFAIEHFVAKGKKVIYTSPIKALSNQKFYEFTLKFPNISFGILTGDIKTNPEADVLIMTTEILMNTLYVKKHKTVSANSFEMDFNNDLACVIFDEIHYINDPDRGRVWEETIMMLPRHIQMVMLSATLDSPNTFASWCENREGSDKTVYLATTNERVVPLTHYSFITCTQGLFKVLKNKDLEKEIMKTTNKFHVIQDSKGHFKEDTYLKIKQTIDLFNTKNHFVKRKHVLNTVSKCLVEQNMLPAICFVLNRRLLEECASDITTVLLEDDSKVPYIVRRECEQIIRKLPNYEEYLHLPEYLKMVSLFEKGIGIHHAGMMPILREMNELLFAKGYIKLLFATETFAVGINMPTKTVLFTDIGKFNGNGQRPLFAHEYTQMAGRAGRRGIDTIGHVVHLTNLFRDRDTTTLKTMMSGKPQTLVSKFKMSYNLILNLVDIGDNNYSEYVSKSMMQNTITSKLKEQTNSLEKLKTNVNSILETINKKQLNLPDLDNYCKLSEEREHSVNKRRRQIDKEMQEFVDKCPEIVNGVSLWKQKQTLETELESVHSSIMYWKGLIDKNVKNIMYILECDKFVTKENDVYKLTDKGKIALYIKETPCLEMATLIYNNDFDDLSSEELVGIFSCFTNVTVPYEKSNVNPKTENANVMNNVIMLRTYRNTYDALETRFSLDSANVSNEMQFELIDYVMRWCRCETEIECKQLLSELEMEKEIFLGEFVKAILKINNVSLEMEKVAEITNNMKLLSALREIPRLTLKYVATNQSLYV